MATAKTEPAETATDDDRVALTFDDVNYATCPNCHTGVLHVLVYDENAIFEKGQMPNGSDIPSEFSSGGAAWRRCWHCDFSDSIPLLPGSKYGERP